MILRGPIKRKPRPKVRRKPAPKPSPAPQTRRPDYGGTPTRGRAAPKPTPRRRTVAPRTDIQTERPGHGGRRKVTPKYTLPKKFKTEQARHQTTRKERAAADRVATRVKARVDRKARRARLRHFGRDPVSALQRSERRAVGSLGALHAQRGTKPSDNTGRKIMGVSLNQIKREAEGKGVLGKAAAAAKEGIEDVRDYTAKKSGMGANLKVQKAGIAIGGDTTISKDVIDLAANAPVGLYQAGAAIKEAAGGDTKRARGLWKDYKKTSAIPALVEGDVKEAAKRATQHPVATALEVSGAKAVVGRTGGAAARAGAVPGTKGFRAKVKRAGSTRRANLKQYPDEFGKGPERERRYSRDIINKAAQVYGERRERKGSRVRRDGTQRRPGRDPNVDRGTRLPVGMPEKVHGGAPPAGYPTRSGINRDIDTAVFAQERAGLERRQRVEEEARDILKGPKTGRVPGRRYRRKPNAAGVHLTVEGTVRLGDLRGMRADARKRHSALLREKANLTDPLRKRKNADERKQIRELLALDDDNFMRMVEASHKIADQQRGVQARGRAVGTWDETGMSKRFFETLQAHQRRPGGKQNVKGVDADMAAIVAKKVRQRYAKGKPLGPKMEAAASVAKQQADHRRGLEIPGKDLARSVAQAALVRPPIKPPKKLAEHDITAGVNKFTPEGRKTPRWEVIITDHRDGSTTKSGRTFTSRAKAVNEAQAAAHGAREAAQKKYDDDHAIAVRAAEQNDGVKTVQTREASPQEFKAAFDKARKDERGAYLTNYRLPERKRQTLILSEDRKAGAAVTPEGDIVSVFRLPDAPKGAGTEMLRAAIKAGGKRLDAIGDGLRKLYEREGFVVTQRVKWDDEYAPKNWDYAKNGRPDIFFMEYRPKAASTKADVQKVLEERAAKNRRPKQDEDGNLIAAESPKAIVARREARAFEAAVRPKARSLRHTVAVKGRKLDKDEIATAAKALQRRERRGKGGALGGLVEGGPTLITQRPGTARGSSKLTPGAPLEPSRKKGGTAYEQGARDVGRSALLRQFVQSENEVTAVEGFTLLEREYGIPGSMSGKRYAPNYSEALETARHLTLDADGNPRTDVPRLTPVNVAAFTKFGGALRARQEANMPRSASAINDMERASAADTWHAALAESGRGKWVLMPEDAVRRLQEHLDVGVTPLHTVTNIFKDVVLTTSSPAKWIGGNVTDISTRTILAGITPMDIRRGRKVIAAGHRMPMNPLDRLAFEQAVHATTGGGLYHASEALNRSVRPVGHDEPIMRTAAAAPFRTWKKGIFAAEHAIEALPQHGNIGKQMRRDVPRRFKGEDEGMKASLKAMLRLHDAQFDHYAHQLATNRAFTRRIQQSTEDVVGRWGKISPNMKRALVIAPFAQWLGASVRYTYLTLPAHHPIKTGIAAGIMQMTQEERQKLGLSYFAEREDQVQDYQMGTLPLKTGRNEHGPTVEGLSTQRMTSLGTAGFAPEQAGAFLFPQFAGPLNAWFGINFTGEQMVYPDWWPEEEKRRISLPPAERRSIGLGMLIEGFLPFASAYRRSIQEGGQPAEPFSTILTPTLRKKWDKDEEAYVENEGTKLGGILEWLMPVPAQATKDSVKFTKKLYTHGAIKSIQEGGITGETLERWSKQPKVKKSKGFGFGGGSSAPSGGSKGFDSPSTTKEKEGGYGF